MPHPNARGFSLVEAIFVIAIIVILAGIAVPTMTMTVEDAKVTSVEQELMRVRTGIDYYKFQHLELIPGFDNTLQDWTVTAFTSQLTKATTQLGEWAAPGTAGYPFGPYLTEGIPSNPYNDLETVEIVDPNGNGAGYPNDNSGWVFFAIDGTFRANTSQLTPDGDRVFDL